MVTFESITVIRVKLDKKHVGDIKEVTGGYAYFPKGSKKHGDIFPSQIAVMADVKGDD